ncbi:MAG: imidazole glycerol phosphate synthase subunit HisF [Bacteroidales bacterium]
MLAKRIIPCLDVLDGKVVKGINFVNLKEVGDPVTHGAWYSEQGADELVYLDITATHEKRKLLSELVRRIAENINIPFTVGGGVSHLQDADALLNAGADKISVNSAVIMNPSLIDQIARSFGSQFLVVAIDARNVDGRWVVYRNGGRIATDRELFEWASEVWMRGAGEILFTSMDHDGVKTGYACHELSMLSETLPIPVIASGGAGSPQDFLDAFTTGKADAALAASVFHYNEISIPELKRYLQDNNITVRF